jgi:hypothetical protein
MPTFMTEQWSATTHAPVRFGVHAAVAPTMSAWRDQARTAEGLGYSTLIHATSDRRPLADLRVRARLDRLSSLAPAVSRRTAHTSPSTS